MSKRQSPKIDEGKNKVKKEDHPFLALCKVASEYSWCWWITCTTCGNGPFRSGLKGILKGRHPADEDWEFYYAGRNALENEPIPRRNPCLGDQKRLIKILRDAPLREIKNSCEHPDWLGYLGLALCATEQIERREKILTEHWFPQLIEMSHYSTASADRLKEKEVLRWQDLENFEHAIPRRPSRDGRN